MLASDKDHVAVARLLLEDSAEKTVAKQDAASVLMLAYETNMPIV